MGAVFVLGVVNSFVHARDAWAVMPDGLILSFIAAALALIALWFALWGVRSGDSQ